MELCIRTGVTLLFSYTLISISDQTSNLKICDNPTKGLLCKLTCKVTPLNSGVSFDHPVGSGQGGCVVPADPSSCSSSLYTVSQIGDETNLEIASLNYSRDNGQWVCINGISDVTEYLYVNSPLGTQDKPFYNYTDATLSITCGISCQYPISAVSVDILYAIKDSNNYMSLNTKSDISNITLGSNGCENHESNLQIQVSFSVSELPSYLDDKSVTFKCNFTQSNIGMSTGNLGPSSETFTFPGYLSSTDTAPSGTPVSVPSTTTSHNSRCECPVVCLSMAICITVLSLFLLILFLIIICLACYCHRRKSRFKN